jgi:hypothetical protein
LRLQAKLAVGEANDPLEHEADRAADQVMRGASGPISLTRASPRISRKCDACEAEDQALQKKPAQAAGGAPAARGLDHVHGVLGSPGRPLDGPTRGFFEPRFGHDFGEVRIHDDGAAAASARAVGARAYTVGRNIVFGGGQYATGTDTGRRLLAHELAHTVQQGRAPASQALLQRKLYVADPKAQIPNPGGKGVAQTKGATVLSYLKTLCPDGPARLGSGEHAAEVTMDASYCKAPASGAGGAPALSGAQKSATPASCSCLCDLTQAPHPVVIRVDDKAYPHTEFNEPQRNSAKPGVGTGSFVTTPSPNSPKAYGTALESGALADLDPWLALGHELCGHALPGSAGKAENQDVAPKRGEGGHQDAVARENSLRSEHGLERRATFKGPYCGESFAYEKTSPGSKNFGDPDAAGDSHGALELCKKWREKYNKDHGTHYKIEDTIP